MAQLTPEDVLQALAAVQEPDLGRDLVSAGLVRDVEIGPGNAVTARIVLLSPASAFKDAIGQAADAAISSLPGVGPVQLTLAPETPNAPHKLKQIRHILGVGAGKGGVGKSTVAVNLAMALQHAGGRVGLLDADVYGPSVPIMLGLRGTRPTVNAQRKIIPAQAHGIKCISMGFLVQEDMAVAWRGPMVGRAVQQFIDDVEWGELDYLVVDLPPGTGDVILSLCQAIPLSGAVVVTTPQDVAFADVLRAVRMFSMLKVEVVGLVENMSWFRCPDNDKRYEIFGPSRSAANGAAHSLELMGQFPIDLAVSPNADAGLPIAVAQPDGEQARLYRELGAKVVSKLTLLGWQAREKASVGRGFFSTRPPA